MSTGSVLVSLRNVSLAYDRGTALEKLALAGVDLEISQGEVIAVVGPVASGKSTLLGILAGILRPTSGRVIWASDSPAPGPLCAMVFQRSDDQLFCSTVFDDVAAGPRAFGLSDNEVDKRVHSALELVSLPYATYAGRNPLRLSTGEKRRVAIAGILAVDPALLCADEVHAGLDPQHSELIHQALLQWSRQRGWRALVFSTHEVERAIEADRVVLLERGRIRAQGPPGEILADPELLSETGLEVPLPGRVALALGVGKPLPVSRQAFSAWVHGRSIREKPKP